MHELLRFLINLRIVAHPIHAVSTLLALVLAPPAVPRIEQHIHAFPSTAHLPVPAPPPALPAVARVSIDVHASPPAAVRPRTPYRPAHSRKPIACHPNPQFGVVLSQLAAQPGLVVLEGD